LQREKQLFAEGIVPQRRLFEAEAAASDGKAGLRQASAALRLAGLDAPIDGVSLVIDDFDRLHADAQRARRQGFGAKLCIHPKQIAAVQAVFTPSAEQLDWARGVRDVFVAAGGAAVVMDGRMVDSPIYQRALAVLRSAGLEA